MDTLNPPPGALDPETAALAGLLYRLGSDDPETRTRAGLELDDQDSTGVLLLSALSQVDAALPRGDSLTRARLYCGLGQWAGRQIPRLEQAAGLLEHAARLVPGWSLPHALVAGFYMQSAAHLHRELQEEGALPEYAGIPPHELELLARGYHDQALQEAVQAILLDPDDPGGYYAFCGSPYLDYSILRHRYLQAVQRDRTRSAGYARVHWDFACRAARLGQEQDAARAFLRAMPVDPGSTGEGGSPLLDGRALDAWQAALEQVDAYRRDPAKSDDLWLVGQPLVTAPPPRAAVFRSPAEDRSRVQKTGAATTGRVSALKPRPAARQPAPEGEWPLKKSAAWLALVGFIVIFMVGVFFGRPAINRWLAAASPSSPPAVLVTEPAEGVVQPEPPAEAPLTIPPDAILFADDFDGPPLWSDAADAYSSRRYEDGRYIITVGKDLGEPTDSGLSSRAGIYYNGWSTAGLDVIPAVIQVEAQVLSGDPQDAAYGLIFHYTDSKNFMLFEVSPRGKWNIVRLWLGSFRDLIPYTTSSAIATGAETNRLRLELYEAYVRFYVNDEEMTTYGIPNQMGDVGLWVTCIGSAEAVEVGFDNFSVAYYR